MATGPGSKSLRAVRKTRLLSLFSKTAEDDARCEEAREVAAMDALRPVLRAGQLPKRTWLVFFDAELADEWLPLWDDAPPPPR